MKLRPHIPHAPMAVIASLFALGIIVAKLFSLPLFVWAVISGLMLLCGVFNTRLRALFLLLSVIALGGVNLQLRHTTPRPPHHQTINGTFEVMTSATETSWGDWNCDITIVEWSDSMGTNRSNRKAKATYKAPTPYPVGTRLKGEITIKNIESGSYATLLEARGYEGYATLYNIQAIGHRNTIHNRAYAIQQAAVERVHRLKLDPSEEIVAEAMILGFRGNMNSTLRQEYADSGSSHILAVSGLHIGIVFILINALLLLLPMVRYGHIIKNIVAIILIWAFAFVSGLSPSAVRAATMFSLIQLGFALSANNNSINTIFGAAFLMLIVDPMYLFDISFQLSYIAVLGISLTFGPLYSRIKSESRILNGIWSMLLVSLCASIAVMPLIAYTFGKVSFIGILLSPAIVILAHISIITGLLWCLMPFGATAPIAHFILQHSIGWQNRIVGATADLPFSSIEWNPSATTVVIIYICYLALCCGLRYLTRNKPQQIVFE